MLKKFATDLTHGLRSMVRGVDADWTFNERRKTLRFNCRHKVDLLQDENKSLAYVIDYSMGGVRLAYPGALKVGERIKLKFPHPLPGYSVNTLDCEIVWRRKNSKTLEMVAGARFVESRDRMKSSWVAYFFNERGSSDVRERRLFYRAEGKLDVVARGDADRSVGEVRNVSLGGAFLKINRPAEVGDIWGLDISGFGLEGVHFKAEVLSCEMGESGLYEQRVKFTEKDEESLKLLRKYMVKLSKDFWTE